jgi:hypothetical protein
MDGGGRVINSLYNNFIIILPHNKKGIVKQMSYNPWYIFTTLFYFFILQNNRRKHRTPRFQFAFGVFVMDTKIHRLNIKNNDISKQGVFLPKNALFLIRNALFLSGNRLFLTRNILFLTRNTLFLIGNTLFLIRNAFSFIRNMPFLTRNKLF